MRGFGTYGVAAVVVLYLALVVVGCGSSNSSNNECAPEAFECLTGTFYRSCTADGAWTSPQRCPTGQTCTADGCAAPEDGDNDTDPNPDGDAECVAGTTECVGSMIRSCLPTQQWSDPTACIVGMTCIDDSCQPGEPSDCQPGEQKCDALGTGYLTCTADKVWGTEVTSCATTEVCDSTTGQCRDASEPECTPPSSHCDENGDVVNCLANGTWGAPSSCGEDEYCGGGACVPNGTKVCDPSVETRCTSGGKLEVCNAQGTGWSNPFDCPAGYTCEDSRCKEGSCTPGEIRCTQDMLVQRCKESGDGYGTPEACPAGEVCNATELDGCGASTFVCTPGGYSCKDPQTIQKCLPDGSGYEAGDIPCEAGAEGRHCINGVCAGLCEIAEMNQSYIGCEYYAVTLPNPQLDPVFKQGNESEFAVVLSNTNKTLPAQVTITYTGGGFTKTVSVPAGSNLTQRLPWKETTGTYKGANAFNIKSTIPVTAYQFNPLTFEMTKACLDGRKSGDMKASCYSYTNDASLLLPVHAYGTEYVGLSQRAFEANGNGASKNGFLTIVGAQDGTTVEFKASDKTVAGTGVAALTSTSAPLRITINKGEVLQFTTADAGSNIDNSSCFNGDQGLGYTYCGGPDLTGSIVTTDKPVAVFGGHECAFVPHYRWACDHLEEQLFPTGSWTTQYIAARMQPSVSNHPNFYKIVAYADGTKLSTIPASVLSQADSYSGHPCGSGSTANTLNRGQFCIIQTNQDFVLVSNAGHPVMVGQFFVGQNFNGVDDTSSSEGDPSLILIPPVEQFRYEYNFLVPSTYTTNYITLLTTTNTPTITLDGGAFSFTGTQIQGINAYKMNYKIADGTHTLVSSTRIGVTVYGYATYVSYAYAAGLDLTYVPY